MKKIIAILSLVLTLGGATAQNVYWVLLTDKAGTTFDPYTYFDEKAIATTNAAPTSTTRATSRSTNSMSAVSMRWPPRRWVLRAG